MKFKFPALAAYRISVAKYPLSLYPLFPVSGTPCPINAINNNLSRTSRPPLWRNLQHRVNRARSPSSFSTEFVALDAVVRRYRPPWSRSRTSNSSRSCSSTLSGLCVGTARRARKCRNRAKTAKLRVSGRVASANPAMRTREYLGLGSSELRSRLND